VERPFIISFYLMGTASSVSRKVVLEPAQWHTCAAIDRPGRTVSTGSAWNCSAWSRNRCSPLSRNPVRVHSKIPLGIIPESRSPWTGFLKWVP